MKGLGENIMNKDELKSFVATAQHEIDKRCCGKGQDC